MGHNANDSQADLQKKYKEVCADLNLDKAAADEAWQSFQRIGNNYSLEGEKMHWLACALYVSCRKGVTPTVGGGRAGYIEGNCVSLTRLLRSCSLSLVMFFNKMKKWSDMASLPHDMRQKLDHLERNFCVTTVIFNKFKPIFMYVFKEPVVSPTKPKSKKQSKKLLINPTEVFSFCWTLFTHVKSQYSAISDDLVNSYHLLLACIDFCYANALTAENVKDLLNPGFPELPPNFNSPDFKSTEESVCIINALAKEFEGLSRDAMGIKEHWWKPCIKRMVERKELKCRSPAQLIGFLDTANFEFNYKKINQHYDQYVLNYGDFDERIFLCENADQELGTPDTADDLAERMSAKQTLKQHMEEAKIITPTTPLSNRHYLKSRDAAPMTPVSSATHTVSVLHSLLRDRKDEPSEELVQVFDECSKNPKLSIAARIQEMGDKFMEAYVQPMEETTNGELMVIQNNEFAQKRLQLVVSLYYKSLENIMKREKKRLGQTPEKLAEGLTNLLTNDMFHVSLFACSAEIVLFSYNSKRTFPWIIDVFSDFKDIKFQAYLFYRVIELLIRDEDGLSRPVVKHLNSIEEQIIESMAWKANSSLWENLKNQHVPSCQEVALPPNGADGVPPSPLSSVKRLSASQPFASPGPGAAGDRFISPSNTPAKRRLFDSGTSTNHAENPIYHITLQSNPNELRFIQMPGGGNLSYVLPIPSVTSSESRNESGNRMDPPKPKTSALGLFFRKVYNLAWLRMRDLCDRLNITDEDLKRKIWTCFELSMRNHTHLMRDRHLDQLLMCAIYSMCKVTQQEVSFTDIMKSYRLQPQARSHIYRCVLLSTRGRRNSAGSEHSKNSSSPSPVEEQKEAIRSSSTLPIPAPNSQPPTPTRLAGSGSQFEYGEERGDLIMFYNQVYVPEMKDFILKFSSNNETPSLSPLPRLAGNPISPYRRISNRHALFVSPLKTNTNFPSSPSRPMSFSVGRSPAKELQAINRRLKMTVERRGVSKRIFQDDNEPDQNKRLCMDPPVMRSKIQNIFSERGSAVVTADANAVVFQQQ